MRSIFINAIVLLLLAACSPAAKTTPQVTVTSEVTVTLTPTVTFTVTPTFTPTSTPAPELTMIEGVPVHSVEQVQADLIANSDVNHLKLTEKELKDSGLFTVENGRVFFQQNNLKIEVSGRFWYGDAVPRLSPDDTWDIVSTSNFNVVNSVDKKYPDYSILYFMDKDGKVKAELMRDTDPKMTLDNLKEWSDWYKTHGLITPEMRGQKGIK